MCKMKSISVTYRNIHKHLLRLSCGQEHGEGHHKVLQERTAERRSEEGEREWGGKSFCVRRYYIRGLSRKELQSAKTRRAVWVMTIILFSEFAI